MAIILQDPPQVIARKISSELYRSVRAKLLSIQSQLKLDIQNLLRKHIESEDQYSSLKFGTLRGHFGLPASRASNRVDNIVREAVSSVNLMENLKVGAKNISGGLTITAIPSNYSELFAMPDATVTTEQGTPLTWLEWLLVLGDAGIVEDWDVKPIRGRGRSGLAIMIIKKGNVWQVPESGDKSKNLRGVRGNNWFTRAIDKMTNRGKGGQLEKVIISRLTSSL